MGVSAALISRYGNGNSYPSSSITLILHTLEKFMIGFLWDLRRLHPRECRLVGGRSDGGEQCPKELQTLRCSHRFK